MLAWSRTPYLPICMQLKVNQSCKFTKKCALEFAWICVKYQVLHDLGPVETSRNPCSRCPKGSKRFPMSQVDIVSLAQAKSAPFWRDFVTNSYCSHLLVASSFPVLSSHNLASRWDARFEMLGHTVSSMEDPESAFKRMRNAKHDAWQVHENPIKSQTSDLPQFNSINVNSCRYILSLTCLNRC